MKQTNVFIVVVRHRTVIETGTDVSSVVGGGGFTKVFPMWTFKYVRPFLSLSRHWWQYIVFFQEIIMMRWVGSGAKVQQEHSCLLNAVWNQRETPDSS